MKDIVIITCYQFEITKKLIELLGRDKCYLVVDSRPDEYRKFVREYPDRIISSGSFGYYTIDEAFGRLDMITNLMKVTKGNFDRVHIISQNDLPTGGYFNQEGILDPNLEYVHINESGWMSNYFTVTPEFCEFLDSKREDATKKLVNRFLTGWYKGRPGAPSELLWVDYVKDYPKRINEDLRLYTFKGNKVYEFDGDILGTWTKSTSPLTLNCSPETRECLRRNGWYLFARKFDFNSPIYDWAYKKAFEKLQNL